MIFISPQTLCRRYGLRPKKALGQNFLVHPEPARRIVAALELTGTEIVVEIGAGLGALTIFLAAAASWVIAVEYDPRLAALLEQEILADCPQVKVQQQDILTFDFLAAKEEYGQPLTLVGNLPYQITSPLLFKLAEVKAALRLAVLMVQQEVADRLLAPPGGKEYGILSILLQYHFQMTNLFTLSPKNFYPAPKVSATVLKLQPHCFQPAAAAENLLAAVVRTAFATRRKTLKNSLVAQAAALGTTPARLLAGLSALGIDPGRRAETLTVTDYVRLTNYLAAAEASPAS